MSVMDIFKNVIGVTTPTNPAIQQQVIVPTVNVDGKVVTLTPPIDSTKHQDKSPLDKVGELFQTDPNIKPKDNSPPKIFNVKPEDLLKAAQSIDFKSLIPNELQVRVKAGGDDAIAANNEITNIIAQHVFAKSAQASAVMTEQAIIKARKEFQDSIPSIVKQLQLKSSVVEDNPLLAHPAFSDTVSSLQSRIQVKFPNASPSEMKSMINDSLNAMSAAIAEQNIKMNPPKESKTGNKQQDWSKFLE